MRDVLQTWLYHSNFHALLAARAAAAALMIITSQMLTATIKKLDLAEKVHRLGARDDMPALNRRQ